MKKIILIDGPCMGEEMITSMREVYRYEIPDVPLVETEDIRNTPVNIEYKTHRYTPNGKITSQGFYEYSCK